MNSVSTFQAPESLAEQIAKHIGQQIITGELKEKERIQEQKICDQLGVSRGSVREALLILERRHLVDILPRKGAMVSALNSHHVNALYDFYIALLVMLVTGLSKKWTHLSTLQPLIEKIAAMQKFQEKNQDEAGRIIGEGFELMHQAALIVDNPYLMETLENLQPAVHRTYYLSMQVRNEGVTNSLAFFKSMVTGVTDRNEDLIVQSVNEFANNQRMTVLNVLN